MRIRLLPQNNLLVLLLDTQENLSTNCVLPTAQQQSEGNQTSHRRTLLRAREEIRLIENIMKIVGSVTASSLQRLLAQGRSSSSILTQNVLSRSFAVGVGDSIPSDIVLHKGFPPTKINLKDHCLEKQKVLLVGLPGAFTPT